MSNTAATMAPVTTELTVEFEFEKTTPGTAKFNEVEVPGQAPKVGSFYVKKFVHQQMGNPARLSVTVKAK